MAVPELPGLRTAEPLASSEPEATAAEIGADWAVADVRSRESVLELERAALGHYCASKFAVIGFTLNVDGGLVFS